jgi:Ca2+-binding RTX toxin-like protein
VLRGNWQANKLSGGAGNDTLYAGDGHDLLEGGSGKDIFVLQPHSGTDTVTDFEIGQDVLEIRGGAQTFAALEIRQSNDGAVIFYHEDNQLILLGIDATKLTEAAFSFL